MLFSLCDHCNVGLRPSVDSEPGQRCTVKGKCWGLSIFSLSMLGMDPLGLSVLSMYSTSELHPSALGFKHLVDLVFYKLQSISPALRCWLCIAVVVLQKYWLL